MNRRAWLRIAGAILAVAAIVFVAKALVDNISALRDEVSAPDIRFWMGAAGAVAIMPLAATLWWAVLRAIGIRVPWSEAAALWWMTNLGKYIPGKAWMVVGRVVLARQHGKGRIVESFAWEFIANAAAAATVAPLLLLGPLRPWWPLAILAWAGALFPIISPRLTQRILQAPMHWLGRGRFEGGQHMRRGPYLLAYSVALVIWLAWGLVHMLLAQGIGLDVSYAAVTGAFGIAWILGYLAIVMPAGLGVREGVMQLILGPVMVPGGAALLALVSRTAILVAEALAGVYGTIQWRRRGFTSPPPSVPGDSAGADDTPGTPPEGRG